MKTLYLPALGYSDTDASRWLTIRLYERIDGEYVHDTGRRIGAWRRSQLVEVKGEIRPHSYALLRLLVTPAIDATVTLVTTCPYCAAVQEHHIERATYAVQCPGCRRIIEVESLLAYGAVESSIGEIDDELSIRMRTLAYLQGYTVRATD